MKKKNSKKKFKKKNSKKKFKKKNSKKIKKNSKKNFTQIIFTQKIVRLSFVDLR